MINESDALLNKQNHKKSFAYVKKKKSLKFISAFPSFKFKGEIDRK